MIVHRTRLPDFFVIGAPRCGTSALWTYLRQHPTVFMCRPKEPHYFAPDLQDVCMTWQEYIGLFRDAPCYATVGEASSSYLFSEVAVPNIISEFPDAKMIVMLRNPIDAAQSAHGAALLAYHEDVTDFLSAWRLAEARSAGLYIPLACRKPKQVAYKHLYSYGDQLQRLFFHVAPHNIHIVISEEFFSDPSNAYAEVLRFLGVQEAEPIRLRVIGANKRLKTGVLESCIRRVTEHKRRGSIALDVAEACARSLLGEQRWRRVRGRAIRKTQEKAERRQLDPGARQELLNEIEDEIQRVERLLGRDLSIWRVAAGAEF